MKRFFLFFLMINGLLGCRPPVSKIVVAEVADQVITVQDLRQAYFREGEKFGVDVETSPSPSPSIKQQLLDQLIQEEILYQEALKSGIHISEEEMEGEIRKFKAGYSEKSFQEMMQKRHIDYEGWREVKRKRFFIHRFLEKKLFSQASVSEDRIKEYYDRHQTEFTRSEAVRVRQIVTDTLEKAESLRKRIQAGENFAHLARTLSISPDRDQEGDIGWISRGTFPKEFEICFDLKVGAVSKVIPSPYGFHVFKVMDKTPQKALTLDEARSQIDAWLKAEEREKIFQNFYQNLKKSYKVQIKTSVLEKTK
jgi:parvulin-like peptidyl-prolyl isomerase